MNNIIVDIKKLWEWYLKRFKSKRYSEQEKKEIFVDGLFKYYIKTKHPELTDKEINNLQKLIKVFVKYSILIIKSQEESTKEIREDLIKLSEKYKL